MANELKTFLDLKNSVIRRAKIATSVTAAPQEEINLVEELLNSRYMELAADDKWRWKRKTRDLRIVAAYDTGTASVVNENRQVTFTGATLTAGMLGRKFKVSSVDQIYEIIDVNVGTSTIKLSERYIGTTNATATYTIFKNVYGMWPDLDKVEYIFREGRTVPLEPIGPEDLIVRKVANVDLSREPKAYTVNGFKGFDAMTMGQFVMGYDFMGDNTLQVKAVEIYPSQPDDDYLLHVEYSRKVDALENDSDEPLIPINNRIILVYGALADYWASQGQDDTFQIFNAKYEKELIELQGDSDFTDDRPRFHVVDRWRGRGRSMGYSKDRFERKAFDED